jgi:hypothetical protein
MTAMAMRNGIGFELSGWGEFSSRSDCKWITAAVVDCARRLGKANHRGHGGKEMTQRVDRRMICVAAPKGCVWA